MEALEAKVYWDISSAVLAAAKFRARFIRIKSMPRAFSEGGVGRFFRSLMVTAVGRQVDFRYTRAVLPASHIEYISQFGMCQLEFTWTFLADNVCDNLEGSSFGKLQCPAKRRRAVTRV